MNTSKKEIVKRFASKGVFPFQMAFTLLIPIRNLFLSPGQLIKRLELTKDSTVLEVGSGPGYFSVGVAGVLTTGRFVLADIQKEMLDYAHKRMIRKGFKNAEYYLCNGTAFEFPDNTFDRIFLVTVIGEVENKDEYLREFNRILKPEGILSISELAGDPDKLSIDEVQKLAGDVGFEFYKLYGTKRNYTINFKKRESPYN